MRESLTSSVRRLGNAWFWPLALLALPNCGLDDSVPFEPPPFFNPGPFPHSSAIMCDIEKFQGPQRRCASADDLETGIPLESAAIALATGQQSNIGLDFSKAALDHCGDGHPEAIDFQGPFPDGFAVCLNCGHSIPPDTPGVCVAQCLDFVTAVEE